MQEEPEKTGIDLPGEAGTIMHKKENIGQVELATIAFGQSFQITPLQLATTAASLINGGERITPHFGVKVQNRDGKVIKTYSYEKKKKILSGQTSEKMRYALEMVVKEGGGKNGQQLLLRHCPEVPTGIFPLFSVLLRPMIR